MVELYFSLSFEVTEADRKVAEDLKKQEEAERFRQIQEQEDRIREQRKDAAEKLREQMETQREKAERQAKAAEQEAAMPKVNFQRLLNEFKRFHKAIADKEFPWARRCELVDDSLLTWELDLVFPDDSPLQRSLEEHAMSTFDDLANCATVQVRFPPEYPAVSPEIWMRKPRLKQQSGLKVTFGGKVCNSLLTTNGWRNEASMVEVASEIHRSLLSAGAEVDHHVAKMKAYPEAPPELRRMETVLYPTANEFQLGLRAMSGKEAQKLGDFTRLEASDKIALPFGLAEMMYGRQNLELPLIFEVKTALGRKTHCAIFDFVQNLPAGFCVLPTWLMDDMFIEENDNVRIRSVRLERITAVKIQPHTLDFYDAVRDSGDEVANILLASIQRYSALTVETSIPIQINGKPYEVQIAELQPMDAVRLIDIDVANSFAFRVDFEAAPDLEDDEDKKARQHEMSKKILEKSQRQEKERMALEGRREDAKRVHYETMRAAAIAAAGANLGQEGDIEVQIRIPSSQPIRAKFPEGAPMVALWAVVLQSQWAMDNQPWAIDLLLNFPKRQLEGSETVTKEIHRAAIGVHEQAPPEDDEELFKDLLAQQAAPQAVGRQSQIAAEHALPTLDEAELLKQTQQAFEVQRWVQAGYNPQQARDRFKAGMRAEPNAPRRQQSPEPRRLDEAAAAAQAAAEAPAPAPAAAEAPARPEIDPDFEPPPEMNRMPEPGEEHYDEIMMVIQVAGVNPYGARTMLGRHDWQVEPAINELLDMH